MGILLLPSYLVNSKEKVNCENDGGRAQTCVLGCARPKPKMFSFSKENYFVWKIPLLK